MTLPGFAGFVPRLQLGAAEEPLTPKRFGIALARAGHKARRSNEERLREGILLTRLADRSKAPPVPEVEVFDSKESPKPPSHLSRSAAAWWLRMAVQEGLLEHELRILTNAAEAWDLGQQARALVDRDSPTFTNTRGNRN